MRRQVAWYIAQWMVTKHEVKEIISVRQNWSSGKIIWSRNRSSMVSYVTSNSENRKLSQQFAMYSRICLNLFWLFASMLFFLLKALEFGF